MRRHARPAQVAAVLLSAVLLLGSVCTSVEEDEEMGLCYDEFEDQTFVTDKTHNDCLEDCPDGHACYWERSQP